MKLKAVALAVVLLAALGMADENCDGGAAEADRRQAAETARIKLCEERGGVPVTAHVPFGVSSYERLERCEFPCASLRGEK